MQVSTWQSPTAAAAIVSQAVVEKRGVVLSQSDAAVSATFKKKFSWLFFILLLGIIYLLYYATKRDESLAASFVPVEGYTVVTFTCSGSRAAKAAKLSMARLAA